MAEAVYSHNGVRGCCCSPDLIVCPDIRLWFHTEKGDTSAVLFEWNQPQAHNKYQRLPLNLVKMTLLSSNSIGGYLQSPLKL